MTECECCGQVFEPVGETRWCKPCLDNRWRQESEAVRLFEPARTEIPGQTGFDVGEA